MILGETVLTELAVALAFARMGAGIASFSTSLWGPAFAFAFALALLVHEVKWLILSTDLGHLLGRGGCAVLHSFVEGSYLGTGGLIQPVSSAVLRLGQGVNHAVISLTTPVGGLVAQVLRVGLNLLNH